MTDSYSTIDKIVRGVLIKIGEDTTHKYEQLLEFAYDFLDELNFDSLANIKDGEFEICRDRDVKLPSDCIDYVMVGIRVGNYIKILRHNNEIPNTPCCGDDQVAPIYQDIVPTENRYLFNIGDLCLYGYGYGGYEHTFSYNRKTRTISFSSEINLGKVYVKYLSSDYGPESVVDLVAKKAAEYYILWQYYLMTRKDNVAGTYERLYYNEVDNKMPRRTSHYTIQDHYHIIGQTYSLY